LYENFRTFDLETFLARSGKMAPTVVVGSAYDGKQVEALKPRAIWSQVKAWLDTNKTVVNHNIAYDLACLAAFDSSIFPSIFKAYQEGRIICTQTMKMEIDIARGKMGDGYKTPSLDDLCQEFLGTQASGKKQGSLPPGVQTHLDRMTAKVLKHHRKGGKGKAPSFQDFPIVLKHLDKIVWRKHYNLLHHLPIYAKKGEGSRPGVNCWPKASVDYVKSDATHALQVFKRMVAKWGMPNDLGFQSYTAFSLHLSGAWGVRVDPLMFEGLRAELEVHVQAGVKELQKHGVFRKDGSENKKLVKGLVVESYGDPSEIAVPSWHEDMREEWESAREDFLSIHGEWMDEEETDPDLLGRIYRDLSTCWNKDLPQRLSAARQKQICLDLWLIRYVEALGNPEAIPFTEKWFISTKAESLLDSENPVLEKRAEISGDKKLFETYIPLLEKGLGGSIHAWWNVLVNSGRTSCRGPNLQNQPQRGGVRECFVPRPGYVYVSIDYASAEMRSLAQVCLDLFGYSALADTLLPSEGYPNGQDPHLKTAASILGITYEDAATRHAAKDPFIKLIRQLAKACNFGYPGGLGAETFISFAKQAPYNLNLYDYAEEHELEACKVDTDLLQNGFALLDITTKKQRHRISLMVAKRVKNAWLDAYPEMKQYFKKLGEDVRNGGGQTQIIHPRTGFVRGGCYFTSGCNHYFQHLTAAGMKSAFNEVTRRCYSVPDSALYGCRTVAVIHDELFMEIPEWKLHEASLECSAIMTEHMEKFTPDIPAITDPAAMRRWRKKAEAAYRDGRLIPWENRPRDEEEVLDPELPLWKACAQYGREPDQILAQAA